MKVSASEVIRAPKEKVFQVFADIPTVGDKISGIDKLEVLSDVKWGVGLRWRETRTMFGKQATEEMEMTGFDKDSSYVVEAESHGTHYISNYQFKDAPGGATEVTWSFEGKPVSVAAKLFSPLAFAFKGSVKKALKKDVDDLKRFIEQDGA
jgi:carbon monoxide dehydrogenase subunit G